MRVVIRTDASLTIGTGHVMRCLTLAEQLKREQVEVSFVCRELPGNLCDFLASRGYPVARLPKVPTPPSSNEEPDDYAAWLSVPQEQDAVETVQAMEETATPIDWMIVDHYGLDEKWERRIRSRASHLMVIDDLANRCHDCDLLLDQNLYENLQNRYDELSPVHCVKLLGPRFALLRPEFEEAALRLKDRDGKITSVLVFFGGCDQSNETGKALQAVRKLARSDIMFDVVIGQANSHRQELERECRGVGNVKLHVNIDYMATLMAQADFALGAGGTSSWERCYLGLPAAVVSVADNQIGTVEALARCGAVWNLGRSSDVTADQMTGCLVEILSAPEKVLSMSRAARRVMIPCSEDCRPSVAAAMQEMVNVRYR